METTRLQYMSPLSIRYTSKEMKYIFSEKKKFTTWHELWIALAKAERELGLDIIEEQKKHLSSRGNHVRFQFDRKTNAFPLKGRLPEHRELLQ